MTLPEPIPIERKCFCKGRGLEPVLRSQEEKTDKNRNRERTLEGLYEEKEQV
jgi:hypothetical protein